MTFECCKKCITNGCCSCQANNNYEACNDVFKELIKKIDELEKENTSMEDTIRELIKEMTELSSKVLQLEQKLDIAVKALEWYDGLENLLVGLELATGQPKGKAKEALEKIKDLK